MSENIMSKTGQRLFRTSMGRRQFLKASAAASGGLVINFSWLGTAQAQTATDAQPVRLNAYILVSPDGGITAMVPNPEFGQNVMTSMPMILAEEMDANWEDITAKTADYSPDDYQRQFTGGSQSIRQGWQSLRMAGAGAKTLLMMAAAAKWQVPVASLTAQNSVVSGPGGKSATFAELAQDAALLTLPEEIALKAPEDFSIVGQSKTNLEGHKVVTGQPLFGIDYKTEGTLIAGLVHPPAFGKTLDSADLETIKTMPGIVDAFVFDAMEPDYTRNYFDTTAFTKLIAIVGEKTWQVLKAKKALQVKWKTFDSYSEKMDRFGTLVDMAIPGGLESTASHREKMEALLASDLPVLRQDGDTAAAFANNEKVIERTYYAPYLAHNTMEPMNFYANVTDDGVHVAGPLQAPGFIVNSVASRLNVPPGKVRIEMTRMGGGFGRRAYSHYLVEAAAISARVKKPVKLMYTREDDMTMGIYRPTYMVRFKAALDENNQLIAYQVDGVGVPEHSVHADRFPAGAVPNYLARGDAVQSNITTGAFRAPRSNFMGASEQAFLDEVAELAGADPIDFRLALFEKAVSSPVGDHNDYDAARYAGVLKQVREQSGWDTLPASVKKGVGAYYCHNSYAAHVVTVTEKNGSPQADKVFSCVDCGIVVNPIAASNMVQGAVIDGIGNAMFGEMTFTDGQADKDNFNRYRMIRMNEIPSSVDVSFVKSHTDPTGLGEPPFPPIFAALANALYQHTGERFYEQPFVHKLESLNV